MAEASTLKITRLMIEAMAKHLPPSASELRMLDINGEAGAVFAELRGDLHIQAVSGNVEVWAQAGIKSASVDAIVAYGYVLNERFLTVALDSLRAGGRLIVVDPKAQLSADFGRRLESQGYTRILVETAIQQPAPMGVLIRGEKKHTTADTQARIRQTAVRDVTRLDLTTFKGRYVHFLIKQTPNLPPWKRDSDETMTWHAVAVKGEDGNPVLLAFSSLPRAVEFMQPAVLDGKIKDINKVGKFARETVSTWDEPVLVNAELDILDSYPVVLIPVDPATAEASDE